MGTWVRASVAMVAIGAAVASAQEPPGAPPADVPPEAVVPAPEPQPLLPATLGADWWWVRGGPRALGAVSDVAVHPDAPTRVAVATVRGAVWLSSDGGASFGRVLGAPPGFGDTSADEDVLLSVEARATDALEDVDEDDFEGDDDGTLSEDELAEEIATQVEDAAAEAAREAAETVRGEVEGDPWFLDQQAALEGALGATRPRVWFVGGDVLALGRADGLFVSTDLGVTWTRTFEGGATALVAAGERYVLGTPSGLRVSTDLVAWSDPLPGTDGIRIHDLVRDGTRLLGATAQGLWSAGPALVFRRHPATDRGVLTVARSPGGAWLLGTERGLLRATDPDEPAVPVDGAVGGVLSLDAPLGGAPLLATGASGTWQSSDDGQSWAPLQRGLTRPLARATAWTGSALLLACEDGLFRLDEVEGAALVQASAVQWIPLSALLASALERHGLVEGEGSRLAATIVPRVELEGRLVRGDTVAWRPSVGSTRAVDGLWQIGTRLTWTPQGRKQQASVGVIVVDDDLVVDDGSSVNTLMSVVGRKGVSYRGVVAEQVTRLALDRAQLALERQVEDREDLEGQVDLALRIQEVEAGLDVWTGGAVTAWNSDPKNR